MPSYLWPVFFKTIEYIDLTKSVVEKFHPSEIRYFPTDDYIAPLWEGAIKSIGKKYEIPVNRINEPLQVELPRFFLIQIRKIYHFSMRMKNSRIIGAISELYTNICNKKLSTRVKNKRKDQSEKRIVCATLEKRHWVTIPGTDSLKHDEQFYPLLPSFRAKGYTNFIFVDCLDSPRNILRNRNDENNGILWNRYSDYLQNGNRAHYYAKKHFKTLWEKIKTDDNFQRNFCYQDIPFFPALHTVLQNAFLILIPDCVRMLSTSKKMLERERPDAIIATYETGPWERALIIEGGLRGIPSIGLQHGMIYDNHYDYMHSSISVDPIKKPNAFIVPKITCVWGHLWKNNLTKKGHYPDDSVIITGHWRYDKINEIKNSLNGIELKKGLSIPSEKKIVGILTANLETLNCITICLDAILKYNDYIPLIKLHPSDDIDAVRTLLKKLGYPENTLFKGDLYEFLFITDFVICQLSTVISEAILMDKNVILANFTKFKLPNEIINRDICIIVEDPEILPQAINNLINDENVKNSIAAKREKYIEDYFFKIDGNSAERVANEVDKLVKRSNKEYNLNND